MKFINNIGLVVFLVFSMNAAHAQTEYLVTVDPSSGTYTIVDSLPGVKLMQSSPSTSAVDKVGSRFFFYGKDASDVGRLYTVNCINGDIISSPQFPPANFSNIGEFEYDISQGVLYGIAWDASQSTEYFLTINPVAGTIVNSVALPGVNGIAGAQSAYDQSGKRYFFYGTSSQGPNYYGVNALTGSIVSMPFNFPTQIMFCRYNNTTSKYYALVILNSVVNLCEVNPVSLTYTSVASFPSISSVYSFPNYATLNETNNTYTFLGATNPASLTTVNLSTGSSTISATFPLATPVSTTHVMELRYHNGNGKLYGLYWGAAGQTVPSVGSGTTIATIQQEVVPDDTDFFDIYPNPSDKKIRLRLKTQKESFTLIIRSATGVILRKEDVWTDRDVLTIDTDLDSGYYFVELHSKTKRQIKKLVVY